MTELDIGIGLPMTGSLAALKTIGGVGAAARQVEGLGLESVWAPDVIVGDGTPALDSVVALSAAAASTERVRVGFSVLVLPLRPVALAAGQLATLQYVSGSRVLLGIGSGGFPDAPFWRAVGAQSAGRGRRTDAALSVLPSLVAGEPTVVEAGQPPVTLAPAASMPDVLVGGNSDVAIRRAVTYGDGWFPSLLAPQTLAERVRTLRRLADDARRGMPGITVGGHAMLGDSASTRAARAALVRSLVDAHGMSAQQAEGVPLVGSPADVAERFAAYAEAGAGRLVLSVDGGDWMRQCELIAEARARLD